MLGKLMKYEFKATWKLLVPMDLFMILMSLLAYATVQLSFFDSDNELVGMTGILIFLTYILSMFVIVIGTVIYLIYRFYTSVYGDEGYLLHTLPVDKHHIIISKALVSVIWFVLNVVLIYLSIIFLVSTNKEFTETITDAFKYYVNLMNNYTNISAFSIFMTIIASFIAMIARTLKIAACISLGQLSPNHKILVAFGCYYGIYFVQRIFNMIYYTVIMLAEKSNNFSGDFYSSLFSTSWEFSMISGLLYCAAFYALTWYIMDKKLNLD